MNGTVRLLLLAGALAAVLLGGAVPASAEEEPPPGPPGRPSAGRFTVQYPYGTSEVEGGELAIYLVEGVFLARDRFTVEARNLVLWADPDRIREEGGPLARFAARPAEGDGEAAPGARPAVPPALPPALPSAEKAASDIPGDLRAVLGPVLHSLYAEGEVRFTLGTRTIRAERLYVDFRRNLLSTGRVQLTMGIGIPSRGKALPLVVRAERMRRASETTLLLEDAEYTTCEFEEPHYSFRCSEFTITDHEDHRTMTAHGNVLRVEGVPVLWLPVLSARSDLSARPLRTASYQHSSRFGNEIDLLWADDIVTGSGRWGEWRLRTDWKSRRGVGAGPELQYDWAGYRGELLTYYQHDTASTDRFNDSPVPREDRGRVRWEHRQRIDPRLRLDLSLFDFSDRNFQREYLKDEYQEERDPETYAYLRYRDRTDFASLSVKYRMDSFRTETVELPEGAFRRIGAQAPPGLLPPWLLDGLTWSLDARAGGYERRWDEEAGVRGDDRTRQDVVARVEGLRWAGPVALAPIALAGGTFTQGLDQPGREGDESRADLAAGLRASTEARRDFPGVASGLLDLAGLRHVAGLEALWYDRWSVTEDPAGEGAVDRVDTLEELRVVGLRLRNRLQTWRGGKRVDWLDLELRGQWFPSGIDGRPSPLAFKEEGLEEARFQDFVGEEKYRAYPAEGDWGPYEGDLRVRLREGLFVLGEAEYDAREHGVLTTAAGIRWFAIPDFSVYLGRRTIAGDSDIYTASADLALSDRWAVHLSQQTDFRSNEGLKTEIGIRRIWHDFVLELGFENDQSSGNTTFRFSLIPSALWEPPTSAERLGKLDFEAQRWYQ